MKYYLAGPMAGKPDHNWPMFKKITSYFRARGYEMVCPTECAVDITLGWLTCMKEDLKGMLTCTGIILLPGWSESRGATFELLIAKVLEFRVVILIEHGDSEEYGLAQLDYGIIQILAHFLRAWKLPFNLVREPQAP